MTVTDLNAIRLAAIPLMPVLPDRAWLPHGLIRKPNGELDKPPREGAKTDAPGSWFTLTDALEKLTASHEVAGIGFAVVKGLITLDFDHCRDPYTGELNDEVQAELERCDSFAYVTPSQTGIRIVGLNDAFQPIPGGKRNRWTGGKQKIEIFIGPTNHYNTFTSDLIPGYTTIRDISEITLDYLQFLDAGRKTTNGTTPTSNPDPQRSIEAIRAALAIIPNPVKDWDEWCRIGMAVWRSSGGSGAGMDAWIEWSDQLDCFSLAACHERWQHWFESPPTKIGFGTLYYEARKIRPLFVPPFDPVPVENGHDSAFADPPPETGQTFEATPLSSLDLDNIPPRRWVYGRELIRGFVSVLASPGGTGKTAYTMAVGVSVAWNKPLLHTGLQTAPAHCMVHKPGNIWFYNLEDPAEELRRRIKATIQHHGVPLPDVAGRIFIDSGRDRPLFIAIRTHEGDLIAAPLVEPLIAELKRRQVAVLVIDPFVQSHSAEENRNEEMNLVMSLWAKVANEADCAIWLIHHFRKGGTGGDAESIRGAGAIQGAARSMHTISTMSEIEAIAIGIKAEERWQYIRHDNAKQNMAPPASNAVWYHLASVTLNNGTPDYPDGDAVQAVEVWKVPSPWEGVTWEKIEKILAKIDAGPVDGEFYAMPRQSKDRWAGTVIMECCRNSYANAADILKEWKENGVLEEGQYMSRAAKRMAACVRVNQAKFSEMRHAAMPLNKTDEDA